jgi:aerobic carbon-monoxide dehydrogenase small subunit
VPVDETLLTTLRHEFALMSVRSTCNIGICGACTVIVDDLPVSACLTLTALCDGKQILTAEGLLDDQGNPDRVQSAFIEHSAFQCSYCTPAMVLTTRALLADHPNPSDDEIREYLAGNLCRCGSYPHVLEAVRSLRSEAEASVEPVVAKEAVHGG